MENKLHLARAFIITTLFFILLIGAVHANSFERIDSDSYSGEIFEPIGSDKYLGEVSLDKGWNLVSPYALLDLNADLTQVRAAYLYNFNNDDYVRFYPNADEERLASFYASMASYDDSQVGDMLKEGTLVSDILVLGDEITYSVAGNEYFVEFISFTDATAQFRINGETTPILEHGGAYTLADGSSMLIMSISDKDALSVRIYVGEDDRLTGLYHDYPLFVNGAMWVYMKRDVTLRFTTVDGPLPTYMVNPRKGWNFLAITPDMIGSSLLEMEGTCTILNAYRYDGRNREWDPVLNEIFSESRVWEGIAVKVADDCTLDSASDAVVPDTEAVPALPDDKNQRKNDSSSFNSEVQSVIDFVEGGLVQQSRGDISFIHNLVDEHGNTVALPSDKLVTYEQRHKAMVGENGKNINVKSIAILGIYKADTDQLFDHLPSDTSITQFYDVSFIVDGKSKRTMGDDFFGVKSVDVVKIGDTLHFYAGDRYRGRARGVFIQDIFDVSASCSFTNQKIQEYCWGRVATDSGDVRKCNNIDDNDHKYTCYANVAVTSKDMSICNKIPYGDRYVEDSIVNCYQNFARVQHDKAICSLIKDDELEASCIRLYHASWPEEDDADGAGEV